MNKCVELSPVKISDTKRMMHCVRSYIAMMIQSSYPPKKTNKKREKRKKEKQSIGEAGKAH